MKNYIVVGYGAGQLGSMYDPFAGGLHTTKHADLFNAKLAIRRMAARKETYYVGVFEVDTDNPSFLGIRKDLSFFTNTQEE